MKLTGIVAILYIAGVTVSVIVLTMLIHTMDITDKRWEATGFFLNSETLSQTNAKDTSESSFRNVVEQIQKIGNVLKNITKGIESIETKRQVIKENQPVRKFCRIPKPNTIYPLCEDKVEYVRQFWNFRCYAEQNNVRNTDLCSILIYLSEVEKWCPRLPWRTVPTSLKTKQETIREKTTIQGNLDDLVRNVLYDTAYKWMRNRITSMKGDWESALSSISEKRDLTKRSKKKILVFLGAFAFVPMIFEQAFSGGPLGELLQWTDVITSLYLLGHELTIIKDTKKLKRVIPLPDEYGCVNKDMERQSKYDLIFTDITGVQFMTQTVGPHLSELRCKFRVLDSFGTEARFNFGKFSDYDEKLKSLWGGLDLNLRQFMTMFPHSPDNFFIGFVSGARKPGNKKFTKKDKALVYGKVDYYWIVGNKKYLDQIHKHVEIHGTFNESLGKRPDYIPRYVINHGVVEGSTIQNMLKESKVFVGLGFPFEGPAPLEAIANGAAFLNPKFSEPRNRYNTNFFAGKPTSRSLTSQNPYAETFIGEPYVYTIDINNSTDVELAMRKIMKTSLEPYIPHEYTHEGMLERVSAQVENLDFCQDSRWPPLQNLVQVKGPLGQSCKDACWKKGLLCEPSYWNIVNQLISFRREGITCEDIQYVERTIAPSYQPKSKRCYFQKQPLLYSCVSSDDTHLRLCPCRDFVKDQVALCKGCW